MSIDDFFEESSPQSRVKVEIVSNYFRAWTHVMTSVAPKWGEPVIVYRDLFAGPGVYEDGTESTPIFVLKQAVADPKLREMLVTEFNDADAEEVARLRDAVDSIPGIETLRYRPVVTNREINEAYAAELEASRLPPSLFFLDPFGWRGLSLRLIHAAVRNRGCDCIFFLNYLRINAALDNPLFTPGINALFGAERAARLRARLAGLGPMGREALIVAELREALVAECGRFVVGFQVMADSGARTSHYLMFVSKSTKGYDIMKNIMAPRSSASVQGVPTFGFNPRDDREPLLPGLDVATPLADLERDLLLRFAGQRLTFGQVVAIHNVGTRYIARNYRDVVLGLERSGRIQLHPDARERRLRAGRPSLPLNVEIIFPK